MVKLRDAIKLDPQEAADFLAGSRTLILGSNGRDGYPHLVAMWYAVKDGDIYMTTYGKAQKAVNIRRDSRVTALVEGGTAYNQLKGLMIRGRAEVVDDPALTLEVLRMVGSKMSGASVTPEQSRALNTQATKRSVIRVRPEKFASWDHSKMAAAAPKPAAR
jgi:PPOX class probable F420-dependent enzyme